jgi:hypothetical protein
LLVITIATLACTTTANAATLIYDAPTFARVDAHEFGLVDVRMALFGQLSGEAAPPDVARGTSTLPIGARNATEAASPGGRAIVIGEDMEGRVIPKANELGADYYDPPAAPRDQWMENNRKWINDRMDEGCTIYDCGPAPGRASYPNPTSPYYQMELDEIAKRSYPVVRVS